MSAYYEKMISAAADGAKNTNRPISSSSTSTVDSSSIGRQEHAINYSATQSSSMQALVDYQSQSQHIFSSQLKVISSDFHPSSAISHLTHHLPHQSAMAQASSKNEKNGSSATSTEPAASSSKQAVASDMSSNNSSSATAITILTPDPTESATSSVNSSPRSICSTVTSEQVNPEQLMQVEHEAAEKAITCHECTSYFDGIHRQPKILNCIHTFCEPCLMRRQIPLSSTHVTITCPLLECGHVTTVTSVSALQTNIPALTMSVVARAIQHLSTPITCVCMSNQDASYLCFSCHQLICQSCVDSNHSTSQHCIEPLELLNLNSIDAACVSRLVDRLRLTRATAPSLMTTMCPRHSTMAVFSYCETCSQPVCQDCTPEHFSTKVGDHVSIHLLKGFDVQTYKHECGYFAAYIKNVKQAVMQLRTLLDGARQAQQQLQQQHLDSNIAAFQQYDQYAAKASNLHKMYSEQSDEFLSGVALAGGLEKFMTDVDQLREECYRLNTLFERARENCSAAEMSSLREWVRQKVQDIRQRCKNINQSFSAKRHQQVSADMRPFVDNEFSKIFEQRMESSRINAAAPSFNPSLAVAAAASSSSSLAGGGSYSANQFSRFQQSPGQPSMPGGRYSASNSPRDYSQVGTSNWSNNMSTSSHYYQKMMNVYNQQQQQVRHSGTSKFGAAGDNASTGGFQAFGSHQVMASDMRQSTSLTSPTTYAGTNTDNSQHNEEHDFIGDGQPCESGVVTDSPTLLSQSSIAIPNRLQLRYIAKIGQFGEADGQFTEPSGIATNLQNQLVVADTNSHRIQIFNSHGAYVWRFGECGKRAGQVLYPNRIAIGPEGEYVFTERAPQCLVQVFDSQGNFLRRFGSGDLRHPRGLCIDHEGHVLVLECQVMSVTIYDMRGTRLRRFNFEGIRFPSSICVNNQQEIFIADNIQHYVFVYSYEGMLKRRIGGYPTINFPVGVAINHLGQLVVADNHNNFNITVFTQEGVPISGYESCVKHAQVLDVCLLNAGRAVAISCKDYRVYVYPYATDGGPLMDVAANNDAVAAA